MTMSGTVRQVLAIYQSVLLPWATARYYETWTGEYAEKNRRESEERASNIRVDVTALTDDEAQLLGFPLWSEESGVRLIPLWLYGHLANGQTLTDINGETEVVDGDYRTRGSPGYIDNDIRGGAIAYGFKPTKASAE